MRKSFGRIAAGILAAAMLACTMSVGAFAEGESTDDTEELQEEPQMLTCVPSDFSQVYVKKYLVMDRTEKPDQDLSFTFDLTGNTGGATKIDGFTAYAGITTGMTSSVTVTFPKNGPYYTGTPTNHHDTTKKYAVQQIHFDFSKVKFENPGVYRYQITEQPSDSPYVSCDNNTCYLDVYVGYKNGQLVILQPPYLLRSNALNEDASGYPPCTEKCADFTNCYQTACLTLCKTVDGNQGNRNLYFVYTVAVTDSAKNATFAISYGGPSRGDAPADTSPTSFTTDASGAATFTVSLKHGQNMFIGKLPVGTHFTITEANGDYQAFVTVNGGKETQTVTADTKLCKGANSVGYRNHKEGNVPTGVMLDVAPYVLMIGVALGGLSVFVWKKRRGQD